MRKLLLLMTALLTLGVSGAWAQRTVTTGSQITSENNIVSGKAYVLKTGSAFISDNGTNYDVLNSGGTSTERTVYYLISNGDGTWKIKNYFTNKFWSAPTTSGANITSVDEASAGSWSLNFANNCAYPTAMGTEITLGLERAGQKMQGWADGSNNPSTGANAQVFIYEVGYYDDVENDLKGKMITVGDAVSSITADTWYVIKCNTPKDGSYYRGSIFENPGALYHNGNTERDRTVKWLFKFENAGETNKYYVKTAYGNYFTDFTDNAQIVTRTGINGKEKITVAKINSTDGHFYFQSSTSGVIMDANGLTSGTASGNVVGWSSTVPTATGGNNDWGIYEVSITDLAPVASEIYTINNMNTDRGPIIYAPAKNTKWVWVSGKDGAKAFDPADPNHQWIFYPSGTSGQYYLYNVGYQKFAIPITGGTYNGYSWAFSDEAVAVTMTRQSNGTFKITSAKGTKYISISKSYTGPVINFNDEGAKFTLTKVADASSSVTTQLTAAVNKLVISQTALTAAPTGTGWYAIRIKYNNDYFGCLYTMAEETSNGSASYPLGFYSECDQIPTISNAQYLVKLTKSYYGHYMQLPNGKYIQNGKPFSGGGEASIKIDYSDENHFTIGERRDANPYYFRPYDISSYSPSRYFIGETTTTNSTYYDIYPINLETAGLTAWTVSIEESTGTEKLICSRDDASGLTSVYNNGYIFLPTGTTPTASDFSVTGVSYGYQVKVDGSAKTITVVNSDAIFATLKSTTKFDILDGSTVMGPGEFANPTEINAAIDAAQAVADNAEAKIAFIESANGTKIQNYLNQVATYGALANIQFTMSKEYGTLILPCPCARIDGLDIYSCSAQENGVLTLTPVAGDYAYNKPYIIHATEGSKYTIIGWDKRSTATHTDGWLTGVLNSDTYIPSGSYMLATNKSTGVQAFYQVSGDGVKCAINKCYLTVPSAGVKAFYFDEDGKTTSIEEIFGGEAEQGAIYNLAGQRLQKLQKGINIINGKKIIK